MNYLDLKTALAGSIEQINFTNYTISEGASFPAYSKGPVKDNFLKHWGTTTTTYPTFMLDNTKTEINLYRHLDITKKD